MNTVRRKSNSAPNSVAASKSTTQPTNHDRHGRGTATRPSFPKISLVAAGKNIKDKVMMTSE